MGMQVTKEIEAALEKAQREGRVAEPGKELAKVFDILLGPKEPPPSAPKKKRPKELQPASWKIELTLPCRVKSEANQRDHWAVRRKRFRVQEEALIFNWLASPWQCCRDSWKNQLPMKITWTHIGPKMDSDNLASAFKGLRDELAHLIGIDDGDERIDWQYRQEKGTPGVRVTLEKA